MCFWWTQCRNLCLRCMVAPPWWWIPVQTCSFKRMKKHHQWVYHLRVPHRHWMAYSQLGFNPSLIVFTCGSFYNKGSCRTPSGSIKKACDKIPCSVSGCCGQGDRRPWSHWWLWIGQFTSGSDSTIQIFPTKNEWERGLHGWHFNVCHFGSTSKQSCTFT